MQLLIVDQSAEGQTSLATRVQELSSTHLEQLDLQVSLCFPDEIRKKAQRADVILFGPDVFERTPTLSEEVRQLNPEASVLLFVRREQYGVESFRVGQISEARKVFSLQFDSADLLQELLAIDEDSYRCGKRVRGRLITVYQVKGGLGATTFSAALGDCASRRGRRTLLWDLDIESSDLSRSLLADGLQTHRVSSWVEEGGARLSREEFREGLFDVSDRLSVLAPPSNLAAGMDLVGHDDGVGLCSRIASLTRLSFEMTVVDLAGRLTPSTGSLLLNSDMVIVLTDDSPLALSQLPSLMGYFERISVDRRKIRLVFSGLRGDYQAMKDELELAHKFERAHWSFPILPFDKEADRWCASRKSLFMLGSKQTRETYERILHKIESAGEEEGEGFMSQFFGDVRSGLKKVVNLYG